ETALVGVVSLDAASNTAVFEPTSNMTAGIVYTATITTAVKSVAGKSLAANYVRTFTSGETTDAIAPTVLTTDPSANELEVALNRGVSAVFDESLSPTSVSATSFTLATDAGVSVKGKVTFSDKSIAFKPTSNLKASTLY